jgi:FAD/FMN-containing dehydrogenase
MEPVSSIASRTEVEEDAMGRDLDLGGLRAALDGQVIGPDDRDYEEARKVWNGVIDKRPAAIVRCGTVEDVVATIGFARGNGLPVTARGGGHNVAGLAVADDALVMDLSSMKDAVVDQERGTVRIGGGATLGDLDRATQAFGLATPLGLQSETGIAGLTLGGGMGWLRRKYGLSCDQLASAEVVTADGTVLTADEEQNTDLFWALRGGGGGFGVVTTFEYRVYPVGPEVMVAALFYPRSMAKEVFRSVEQYTKDAPEDISPLAFLGTVPPAEPFPEEAHGAPAVIVGAMHPGEPNEGERLLQPLRELGDPIMDLSGPMPYVQFQSLFDEDYPNGRRYYWKSIHLAELGDEVLERLVAHGEAAPSMLSTVDVWYQGGAMTRVGPTDTAVGDRSSPILIGVESNWEDPADDDANVKWARDLVADMSRFPSGGAYLNFPGFLEEGEQLLKESFGPNYERLQAVKETYDPSGMFQGNRSVRPGGG